MNQAFLGPRESAGISATRINAFASIYPKRAKKPTPECDHFPGIPVAAAAAGDESGSQDRPCKTGLVRPP
jgi:hypothetical protein